MTEELLFRLMREAHESGQAIRVVVVVRDDHPEDELSHVHTVAFWLRDFHRVRLLHMAEHDVEKLRAARSSVRIRGYMWPRSKRARTITFWFPDGANFLLYCEAFAYQVGHNIEHAEIVDRPLVL